MEDPGRIVPPRPTIIGFHSELLSKIIYPSISGARSVAIYKVVLGRRVLAPSGCASPCKAKALGVIELI